MSNNNSTAIIVVGLLGFVILGITGKWLLENNKDHCEHGHCNPNQQIIQPQVVQPMVRPVVRPQAMPPEHTTKHYCPEYHSDNMFWRGYSDGWNRLNCLTEQMSYMKGYEIGVQDRSYNRHCYYDEHCPPGFSLRIPGFSLRVK